MQSSDVRRCNAVGNNSLCTADMELQHYQNVEKIVAVNMDAHSLYLAISVCFGSFINEVLGKRANFSGELLASLLLSAGEKIIANYFDMITQIHCLKLQLLQYVSSKHSEAEKV